MVPSTVTSILRRGNTLCSTGLTQWANLVTQLVSVIQLGQLDLHHNSSGKGVAVSRGSFRRGASTEDESIE